MKKPDSPSAVFRPWGHFAVLQEGAGYQIKQITVEPRQRLSLQRHKYRAEHWIVITGTAKVTCDEKEFCLEANESTLIPTGAKHRIENPKDVPLTLIEVQTGSYFGEDDIERLDDDYGRIPNR